MMFPRSARCGRHKVGGRLSKWQEIQAQRAPAGTIKCDTTRSARVRIRNAVSVTSVLTIRRFRCAIARLIVAPRRFADDHRCSVAVSACGRLDMPSRSCGRSDCGPQAAEVLPEVRSANVQRVRWLPRPVTAVQGRPGRNSALYRLRRSVSVAARANSAREAHDGHRGPNRQLGRRDASNRL